MLWVCYRSFTVTIRRAEGKCLALNVSLRLKADIFRNKGATFWISLIGLTLSVRAAAPLQLVSVRDSAQPPPAGGSGDSWGPLMTPDGRFVIFSSTANNLTTTSNGNALPVLLPPHVNVFLRDRAAGTTALVSLNATGTGGGNGDSIATAIS